MLKVSHLIRQEERIRHEFIVNREETLESAYDHTEYVFLCEMVHQGISVKGTLSHLYNVEVVVSKRHAIPQD